MGSKMNCVRISGRPSPWSAVAERGPLPDGMRTVMLLHPEICSAAVMTFSNGYTEDGAAVSSCGLPSPLGLCCPAVTCGGAGGSFPVSRYSRLLAQGYDMTTPLVTITSNGITHHAPRTLCQFQYIARPPRPRRKITIFFKFAQPQSFGHQMNGPVITRMKNAKL